MDIYESVTDPMPDNAPAHCDICGYEFLPGEQTWIKATGLFEEVNGEAFPIVKVWCEICRARDIKQGPKR